MAITAKPTSYTVNTGHAKCPTHLWMLNEGTGTTSADEGSGTALNLTLDNADQWSSDALGVTMLSNTASSRKAVSATGTLPSTSILLVSINKTANNPFYGGAANEALLAYGYSGGSGSQFGYIRAQPQISGEIDAAAHDSVSSVAANSSGLYAYDQSWHMIAVKFATNKIAISVDGSAFTEETPSYTFPVTSGSAPNRFALGSNADSDFGQWFNGSHLAAMVYEDDYATWDTTWIAALYADPWQFLNTSALTNQQPQFYRRPNTLLRM